MNVTEACKYILPKIQSFYSDRVNELKRLTDLREISLFQKIVVILMGLIHCQILDHPIHFNMLIQILNHGVLEINHLSMKIHSLSIEIQTHLFCQFTIQLKKIKK